MRPATPAAIIALLCALTVRAPASARHQPIIIAAPGAGPLARAALRHLSGSVSGMARAGDQPLKVQLTPLSQAASNLAKQARALLPWQRQQCYALYRGRHGEAVVAGTGDEGIAFGIADLETRLHTSPLSFDLPNDPKLESPAIEERGEYLNIGYDIAGITPHQWDSARWSEYIDLLALARLNRFYLFLWGSDVTAWSGSKLSASTTSRRLYAELPRAIRYAHSRGIRVTLMLSPTLIPRDVWQAHPDWHADIEYARAGFPVICPNHPQAWKAATDALRAQVRALREVDTIQVWFYDPGGCWCTARGCRQDQAASLVRQVVETVAIYRSVHRGGGFEVNLWPISLWERQLGITYRDALTRGIRSAFSHEWRRVTMVGTPEEGPTPTPRRERDAGFRTGLFLFAANPESAYSFFTPHLRYMPWAAQVARTFGVNSVFSHRLEAWTRCPATYLMSRWLWSPDQPAEEAVARWAEWQAADPRAAVDLARAVVLLDKLTDDGADAAAAGEMVAAMDRAIQSVPPARRGSLADLRATVRAVAVISESAAVDADRLAPIETRFGEALAIGPSFAPLRAGLHDTFTRYRKLLVPGWRKLMF